MMGIACIPGVAFLLLPFYTDMNKVIETFKVDTDIPAITKKYL